MLDRFIFGDSSRISPEAPVPVVHVSREQEMPGGACNVAMNVVSLGGRSRVCGTVGDDYHGGILQRLMAEAGLECEGVVVDSESTTTVKTRIIAQRQQVARVDYESLVELSEVVIGEVGSRIERLVGVSDAVVIEDYGKGVVNQRVVDAVISAAGRRGIPVGFDPKDNHELDVRGVTVATPNRKETFEAAGAVDRFSGEAPLQDRNLLQAAATLFGRWGPSTLMVTLGADGILLYTDEGDAVHVPTRAREVFDVSGAGDTVIAVFVSALAAGAEHYEAAELANFAAGVVVGKLGTAVTTPNELIEFMRS